MQMALCNHGKDTAAGVRCLWVYLGAVTSFLVAYMLGESRVKRTRQNSMDDGLIRLQGTGDA